MDKGEVKKLGPLSLRLIEGLSGPALRMAQQLEMKELTATAGVETLLTALNHGLKPRREQEARELYSAGAREGGVLSRQVGEPMSTYLVRRRAWYSALLDLDSTLKLPEAILAEQVLLNSGLSHDHQLMIRTALSGNITVDRVAEELVNQHSRVHERERHKGKTHDRRDWRGKGGQYRVGYFTDEIYETEAQDDGNFINAESYVAENDSQEFYATDYHSGGPSDLGGSADSVDSEVLLNAMIADGLDVEDEQAMEFAAEVIQGEQEIFFARQQAQRHGFKGFKGKGGSRQFDVSGQLSLQEREQRIQNLKSKTSCRRCGQVGHWSGDPSCPKGKGKTKKGGSGGGAKDGGGKGKSSTSKPRTVYFAVRDEDFPKQSFGYMAFNAVPPPSSLMDTPESPQQLQLQTVHHELERVQQQGRLIDGTALSADDLDTIMLLETLGGDQVPLPESPLLRLSDAPQEVPPMPERVASSVTQPSTQVTGTSGGGPSHAPPPCQHAHVTTRGSNAYYLQKRCLDCGILISRERKDAAMPSAPQPASSGQCQHNSVTWRGTNAHRWRRTCLTCGQVSTGPVVQGERRVPETPAHSPSVAASQSVFEELVGDIHVAKIPSVIEMFRKVVDLKLREEPDAMHMPANDLVKMLKMTVQIAGVSCEAGSAAARSQAAGSVGRATMSSPSTSAPRLDTLEESALRKITFGKHKDKTFGEAWKDQNYVKWCLENQDAHSNSGLKSLTQYFRERIRAGHHTDFDVTEKHRVAMMAIINEASENDMLAILDTGCNVTCHGSEWLMRYCQTTGLDIPELLPVPDNGVRGIGGNISIGGARELPVSFALENGDYARGTMYSLELSGSSAPLLLSIKSQKQLGFKIDIANHVVESTVLGSNLLLTDRDGLMAIRLLPGHLGLYSHVDDQVSEYEQVSDGDLQHVINETLQSEDESGKETDAEVLLVPEAHLAVDELPSHRRVFTKGQKKAYVQEVAAVHEHDSQLWNNLRSQKSHVPRTLPKGCRTFLMEIFAGAAILSSLAAEYGYRVSQPVDILLDGTNLLSPSHRQSIERKIEADDPYLLSFAPVCGPWGPWQSLNMSRSPQCEADIMQQRKMWYPVVRWMCGIIRSRVQRGRQVLLENPWPSKMWSTLAMERLLAEQLPDAITGEKLEVIQSDQCLFGLANPETGFPWKKSTGLLTASPGIKNAMNLLCDGSHQHELLEGGSKTKKAQTWPVPFCEGILRGVISDLDNVNTLHAFPAEAEAESNPFGSFDRIYDQHDIAGDQLQIGRADEGEIRQEEQREQDSGATTEGDEHRKREWNSLPFAQRVAIRRLHTMTGHSSTSAMTRMLRLAKASPEVLHKIKHFRCETCQLKQPSEPRPTVRPPGPYVFNHEIAADTFEVRDSLNNKYTVLSIVCLGTLYHGAWIVADRGGVPSSASCAAVFRDHWFSWAGPPKTLVVDQGVANRGKLAALMSSQGVYLRYAGTEAAHQIGRAERQGGILKDIIHKAVESRGLVGSEAMRMVVTESSFVKNNRLHNAGFTPAQWVLGKLPVEVCSLTSEDEHLAVHEEMELGESRFSQQMNIRQAAKEGFAFVDSSDRVRRALLRRSTPLRGPYSSGDLVCFRRQGRWFGPGRVVGREGRSNLWIVHAGIPMVVSEDNVRPSNAGEVLAKQLLELKPSRKRRRATLEEIPEEPSPMVEVPFSDDVSYSPSIAPADDGDQGGFFDLTRDEAMADQTMGPSSPPGLVGVDSANLPAPPGLGAAPPGLGAPIGSPLTSDDPMSPSAAEPLGLGDAASQAGLLPDQVGLLPEEMVDDTQPTATRQVTVEEPDLEPPDHPVTSTPSTPTTFTPLQTAMHRSLDALDGVPRPSHGPRDRSRSPTRYDGNLAMMTENEKKQAFVFKSFLARRQRKNYNKKKAVGKELNFLKSPPEIREKIAAARRKEWENWSNFEACDVIPPEDVAAWKRAHPGVQVLPMRWVDINKAEVGEPEKMKSRIVVLGHLEKAALDGEVRTDSPTASHLMLSLLLTFASCNGLLLRAGDITAAFLQGMDLSRILALTPPKDGIEGVHPQSLLIAKKPVYGTRDAPRGFWRALHDTIISMKFRQVPHENATYVMNTPDGQIDGMLICHVDDIVWCGGDLTQAAMTQLQTKFAFGKIEDTSFKYCGRMITQDRDGISVTCPYGLDKTRPIQVTPQRKSCRAAPATNDEQSQLRSVLGSINWVVRVCRPDLAYDTNRLQTCVQKPCVQDLLDCNALLRRAQTSSDVKLFYGWKKFDFSQMQILSITDASHAADFDLSRSGERLGGRSQSGRILAVCGPDFIEKSGGPINILEWKSTVVRRVCRSTLQAESLSMLSGYEDAEHLRQVIHGLYHTHHARETGWRVAAMDSMNVIKLTDCRSLSEHLLQAGLGEVGDKRLAIDISGMRQMVWRERGQEVGDPLYADFPPVNATTRVHWISTKTMLSDGLTKHMLTDDLRHVMSGNDYQVNMNFHAKKKDGCEDEAHFLIELD